MDLVKGKKYYVLQKESDKIVFIGIFIGKKDDKLYFFNEPDFAYISFDETTHLFFNFTSRL
jgi:hypothetical protein